MRTPARQSNKRYPLGSGESSFGWLTDSLDDIMDRINDIPNTGTVALAVAKQERHSCPLCDGDWQ